MAWTKYVNCARDRNGSVIANVQIIIDYNDTSQNRIAALLEVKDWASGGGIDITIDPSDVSAITWEEGTDFTAETSNAVTAENIATAINGTTNFTATAKAGHEGNPYVSIVYTSGGHLDSVSTDDSTVWEFYSNGKASTGVPKVAQDDAGTIKHQPLWTNGDGLVSFYIDAPADVDILAEKPGKSFDNTFTEDVTIAT